MFIPYLSFGLSRYLQPKKLDLGYPRTSEDIFSNLKKTEVIHGLSYTLNLVSFQSHAGSLGSSSLGNLAAPSVPGCMATQPTLSPVLYHSDLQLLGLSHQQTPQTRLAPPKLPQ